MTAVALITGGIGGLGSEMCKVLYDQGHQVFANHLPVEAGDVSDFDSCSSMVSNIQEATGKVIQILINCAGITRDATLKKMEPENWNAVININLNSLFNVTRQVIDAMMESGYGRIINISSVNGTTGQFGQTNYSAAKAGVHGFTMALARETARKGVTVNSISPGYIETAMTQAVPEEIRSDILKSVPMGRIGKPSEIGAVAGFLCSDGAAYITGANIPVNGGLHMEF
jgi:acetoacetyl-CoA reductase